MSPEISNQEAIQMMNRCKAEILSLRACIDRLQPKADAYDNLATVLRLLPQRSVGMGEDLRRDDRSQAGLTLRQLCS